MVKLPSNPSRKKIALYGVVAGPVLLIAGFALIYFVVFPTSSPAPFKLNATTNTDQNGTTSSAATASTAGAPSRLAGSWKVAAGSEAGYRVREKLAFLPAESDAVGRTSQLTGSVTFSESGAAIKMTAASFNVDVLTLKSDRSMRDEKIKEIGLESSRYPTATFVLSKPISVPAAILKGSIVHVQTTGVFNIHGVSKPETLPVEMSATDRGLRAVGSITFPWGEFGMTAPSLGGFVNVTEHATMEFDLQLAQA